MSYGDDDRWGGCLKVYGRVITKFEYNLGCLSVPVLKENEELKKPCYPEILKPTNKRKEMEEIQKVLQEIFNGKLSSEGPPTGEEVVNTIPVND